MLPSPDARPLPRSAHRGPEPLRRKRAGAPAPAGPVTAPRRKILNGLLAFATAVLLIDAFVGEKGLLEGLRARASFREAQVKLDRLRAENSQLRERIKLIRDAGIPAGLGTHEPGTVLRALAISAAVAGPPSVTACFNVRPGMSCITSATLWSARWRME